MTTKHPLERLFAAMRDPAIDVKPLVVGTHWEDDPRIAALEAAETAVGDLLWEMHAEAEDREGRLCRDCAEAAKEEATRP